MWLAITGICIIIAKIAIGACRYQSLSIAYRIILLQTSISLIAEAIGFYYSINKLNNILIYNLYIIVEVCSLIVAAYLLIESKKAKLLTLYSLLPVIGIWCYNMAVNNTTFTSSTFFAGAVIIVTAYLYILLIQLPNKATVDLSLILLSLAHIYYYAATTPVLLLHEYLYSLNQSLANNILYINNVISIFSNLLIVISFYAYPPFNK